MVRGARKPKPAVASPPSSDSVALLDLYRAAQRSQAEAFGAYAFEWLRPHISFQRGAVVTTFEEYAGWVDAHFVGIPDPRALMESHAKVRHLDIPSQRMMKNPMRAHRTDGGAPELAGPRYAPFREHLLRFDGWYVVSIAVPSLDRQTTTVVMVCRDEKSAPYADADEERMQSLGPHIAEAAAVNRTTWLPRTAAGALPVALLDAQGRFVQTTASFVPTFWPNAPPSTAYIPAEILRSLHKGRSWPLPGGKHTLYGEPDDAGSWHLRLRATSPLDQLSTRERQVATLFARGTRYKAIATRLGLAPTTVRNHLQNLYAKLGVTQREELLELIGKP